MQNVNRFYFYIACKPITLQRNFRIRAVLAIIFERNKKSRISVVLSTILLFIGSKWLIKNLSGEVSLQ